MSKRGIQDDNDTSPFKKAKTDEGHRFLIGAYIPGIVIGKGGEKIKSVRESAGVGISISNSDNRDIKDRVMTIRGDANSCATAIGLITQHILQHNETAAEDKQASTDCRLLVHERQAGAILGKAGATIKQIMADSGAHMRLSNEALPGSTDKACSITGTPSQIQDAVLATIQKTEENPLREGTPSVHYLATPAAASPPASPYGASAAPQQQLLEQQQLMAAAAYFAQSYPGHPNPYDQMIQQAAAANPYAPAPGAGAAPTQTGPQVQFDLTIAADLAGAVIGKGGAGCNNIKAQTGCNVSVGDATSTGTRAVAVRGPQDAIGAALGMIRQLAEPQGSMAPTAVTETMTIPSAMSGAVIGKGGKTIKDIKSQSGCHIQLAEPSAEAPDTRTVSMTGGPIAIQIATYLVQQKCEAQSAFLSGGAVGDQQVEQVSIPSMCVGNVIGKGGATINSIKQQSGCNVSIAEASPTAPDTRIATIKGSASGIQTAVILINQCMQAQASYA